MEPNPVIIAATAKHTASVSTNLCLSLQPVAFDNCITLYFVFQLIFLHGLGDTGLVISVLFFALCTYFVMLHTYLLNNTSLFG